MNYYVMNAGDDSIVECLASWPTQAQLQQLADDFECAVYVIEGQHAGLTAVNQPKKDKYEQRPSGRTGEL